MNATELHQSLTALINSAKSEGLTYNEVLGPLTYLTASLAAAASIQTGAAPEVVIELLHHELDVIFTGVLDGYRRQAA